MKKISSRNYVMDLRVHFLPVVVWFATLVCVVALFSHRAQRYEVVGIAQVRVHQIAATARGRLSGYEPVTLSLAASEKTVTAKTPVSTDELYEIGFHIRALNLDEWDHSGSRVVLLVEPAER